MTKQENFHIKTCFGQIWCDGDQRSQFSTWLSFVNLGCHLSRETGIFYGLPQRRLPTIFQNLSVRGPLSPFHEANSCSSITSDFKVKTAPLSLTIFVSRKNWSARRLPGYSQIQFYVKIIKNSRNLLSKQKWIFMSYKDAAFAGTR